MRLLFVLVWIGVIFSSLAFGLQVSDCGILNKPNTVYTLSRDIKVSPSQPVSIYKPDTTPKNCLTIAASGITLDCGGKSIIGYGKTNPTSLKGGKRGIYVGNSKSGISAITIKNCGISGFHTGIFIGEGASKVTISKNKVFSNGNSGIRCVTGGDDSVISQNSVFDNTNDGIGWGRNSTKESCNKALIKYNNVYNNGWIGIKCILARGVSIVDNNVSKNLWSGIDIGGKRGGCPEARVSKNTLSGNGDGIWCLKSDGATIAYNYVANGKDLWADNYEVRINGVYLDQCNGAKVVNNVVRAYPHAGVHCEGSADITAKNNTIYDNEYGGIFFYKCPRGQFINNKVNRNGGNGIECDSSISANVYGNTVVGNAWDGINIFECPSFIGGANVVNSNRESGIECFSSNKLNLKGNRVGRNRDYGVEGDCTVVTLTNNTASNNYRGGFKFFLSSDRSFSLTDNLALSNRGCGYEDGYGEVVNPALGIISGNRAKNNSKDLCPLGVIPLVGGAVVKVDDDGGDEEPAVPTLAEKPKPGDQTETVPSKEGEGTAPTGGVEVPEGEGSVATCPKYPIPFCEGELIEGGLDQNGCPLEPKCVPKNCPQYSLPLCQDGSEIISGGVDEKGCSLPSRCVPNGEGTVIDCPIYTPPICQDGEETVSGGVDERGCELPGKCVSKDGGAQGEPCPKRSFPYCEGVLVGRGVDQNGCQIMPGCIETRNVLSEIESWLPLSENPSRVFVFFMNYQPFSNG
ncbi:right-handed parallel beta-helix repeat-containing protein [Candidatus Woesearchaeota archaeon]|nr:right-handed parallel beta-helix repeat-containing protein [Candidatus Woesearchaeota archaeon]